MSTSESPPERLRCELYRVREIPVELACAREEAAYLELPVVDPDHGRDLGEIPGREDLVGCLEILVAQRLLDHGDAVAAQEIDQPLPRDAVEEGAVRRRRVTHAVFRHEDIGVA